MVRANLMRGLFAAAALLGGCNAPDAPAVSSSAARLSSDEFHNGGTAGFVWLPPMVAPPARLGDIVPTVPATVRVDELETDGGPRRTVATFTTTGIPTSERVRVNLDRLSPADGDTDPSGSFLARWTSDRRLSTASTYRVRVLVPASGGNLRELGFADVRLVKSARELRTVDTANYVPLIAGDALVIPFRIDRPAVDRDGDGVLDWLDDCPATANPDQKDTLGDGVGDACRCDGVVCQPDPELECETVGACVPTTGSCGLTPAADGTTCTLDNAEGSCTSGECGIASCRDGWANCDGVTWNGCETALNSMSNCGACGRICTAGTNQVAECSDYFCRRHCAYPYESCGGACVDLSTDPSNCGECGQSCGESACTGGVCASPACDPGMGDCDGEAYNGCETPLDSLSNCGACGNACGHPDHTNLVCTGGACEVDSCDPGYANCNGKASDGCETPLFLDPANCGSCGHVCSVDHTTSASCGTSGCFSDACVSGFGNCDGNLFDGCETNLLTDVMNCGACGQACVAPNASGFCSSGTCVFECAPGWASCGGAPGCDVDVMTDPFNCGGCGQSCDDGDPATIDACSGGTCWRFPAT